MYICKDDDADEADAELDTSQMAQPSEAGEQEDIEMNNYSIEDFGDILRAMGQDHNAELAVELILADYECHMAGTG